MRAATKAKQGTYVRIASGFAAKSVTQHLNQAGKLHLVTGFGQKAETI